MKTPNPAPGATSWQSFEARSREIFTAGTIRNQLDWDQNTYMPEGSGDQRGDQLAWLEAQLHRLETDDAYFDSLKSLDADRARLDSAQAAAVSHALFKAERRRRVPARLVEEMAKIAVRANASWMEARKQSDFSIFETDLAETLKLKIELGQALAGSGGNAYEGLVADYEPGFEIARMRPLFAKLREELVPLIAAATKRPRPSAPVAVIGVEDQAKLNRFVLEWMGFDFTRGRLDVSAHPFCGGGGSDIRLTTRYSADHWRKSFYGTAHEGGHGLYEQGMERRVALKALREAPSFGLHESQSRFWENQVTRSRAFCDYFTREARDKLGVRIADSGEALFAQVNEVEPSYIRVEADEATYNLHILLRFEMEEALFSGDLKVRDLPGAWWQRMKTYLDLPAIKESQGVLQDVHWAVGLFGYFPSYTLGNLIAAQLLEKIRGDFDFDAAIGRGDSAVIREWLGQKIHAQGAMMRMPALVREVTGSELTHQPFVRYLKGKLGV